MTVIAEYYRAFEQGQEEASLGFPPAALYYADPRKGNKEWRAQKKGYVKGYDNVITSRWKSRLTDSLP